MLVLGLGAAPAAAEWRLQSDGKYGWYQDGQYTGRWLTENAYNRMVNDMAGWSQKAGATGQAQSIGSGSVSTQVKNMLAGCESPIASRCASIRGKAAEVLSRAGAIPVWRTLGALGAGVFAAQAGWKIGTFFMKVTHLGPNAPSGSGARPVTGVVAVTGGDRNASEYGYTQSSFDLNGVTCENDSPDHGTAHSCAAVAPADGFFLVSGSDRDEQVSSDPSHCQFLFTDTFGFAPIPSDGSSPQSGSCLGTRITHQARFKEVQVDELPRPYSSGTDGTPDRSSAAPAPATDQKGKDGAQYCLTAAACDLFSKYFSSHDGVDDGPGELPDSTLPEVPAPGAHEQYQDYLGRLHALGLEGEKVPLADTATDPNRGPNEVVTTNPAPYTAVQPNTTIKVRTNPDDAPEPGAGDSWSPPPIRALNFTPISGLSLGCNTFPFGIFCWLHDGLGAWNVAGACPTFTIPFAHGNLVFDLCTFEPAMAVARPVLVVVSVFCIAYLFAAAALGFGGAAANEE